MVKTALQPIKLEELEALLQKRLHSEPLQLAPLQVRCLLKEGTLIVLVEHPESVMPYQKRTFSVLEQTVREQNCLGSSRVLIYMRVLGQKQPYAFHIFELEAATEEIVQQDFVGVEGQDYPEDLSGFEAIAPTEEDAEEALPEDVVENVPLQSQSQEEEEEEKDSAKESLSLLVEEKQAETFDVFEELPEEESVEEEEEEIPAKPKSWLPIIWTGVGISLSVFLASLYVLTRPCVLGECSEIGAAQKLANESANTLQEPESGKAILEAQVQLDRAIELLQSIPFWSKYRGEAQNYLQAYQESSASLEEVVSALQTAAQAAYQSQNTPLQEAQWVEAQQLWQEAIASLKQIPPQSDFYELAQSKIPLYETNLQTINQRLSEEKKAKVDLKLAEEVSRMAEARHGISQSLENWQLAQATWQTAINKLKEIPKHTTSYEQAQEKFKAFSPRLAQARDYKMKEQVAANAYNQGMRLAELAKSAENIDQWSRASYNWRSALNYVKQVPEDTFYYYQAQPLIKSYSKSLEDAEKQLLTAMRVQQARGDLEKTCAGNPRVCFYTLNKNVIKVRLTPAYLSKINQNNEKIQSKKDYQAEVNLRNHVFTLGQALETISEDSRTRVEVYKPDGSLATAYTPEI
ncbi:MAG: hypothetical protein WBG70_12330 [Spirulinaceae cyanobacterium]